MTTILSAVYIAFFLVLFLFCCLVKAFFLVRSCTHTHTQTNYRWCVRDIVCFFSTIFFSFCSMVKCEWVCLTFFFCCLHRPSTLVVDSLFTYMCMFVQRERWWKENTPSIRGHGALFVEDEEFLLLLRKKQRERARDVDVYITEA
jgi:hypothetical protein